MITWPICVIAVNLYVHCPLKFLSRIWNTIVNWYYYCLLVSPLSTGDTMSTGATNVYWWRYHCLYYCYYCLSMYNFLLVLLFSTCLLQFFSFLPWTRRNLACFFVFIHWNTLQHRTRVYQIDADRISIITGIHTCMLVK